MAEQRIKIPRLSDKIIFDCFSQLARTYSVQSINLYAFGLANIGRVDVSSTEIPDVIKSLLSKNSTIIDMLSIGINGLSVSLHRGGDCGPEMKSGVYDEIKFYEGTQQVENGLKIDVAAFIIHELKAFDPKRRAAQGVTEEQAQLEAIHSSILERLEETNLELISKSSDFRQKVEEEYQQRKAAQEVAFKKKQDDLELSYISKRSELLAAKEALDKRLKEVDDRDNTHVRRELRKALHDEIRSRQTRFHLTEDTNKLRFPIHALCIFTIAVLGLSAMAMTVGIVDIYIRKQEISSAMLTILILKSTGLTIAAIAFTTFYLRWQNRWLEQHTQAEFQLKQFQLDVDRASWVVETALAWNREGKDVMPTVLLESITRNLFQGETKRKETPLHPGDQLASALLGTASKVRIKAGDAELEFNGKDLKKKMGDDKDKD